MSFTRERQVTPTKKRDITQECISFLNSILGYTQRIPDAPATTKHRILDRPQKSQKVEPTKTVNYKIAIFNFVRKNPRRDAKYIAEALGMPHQTVNNILCKSASAKEINRDPIKKPGSFRPTYLYWMNDEES